MSDTTVKKVSSATSPKDEMGQIYLTSGKHLAMRLWRDEPPQANRCRPGPSTPTASSSGSPRSRQPPRPPRSTGGTRPS